MKRAEFPCNKCGACCRNVDKSEHTAHLNRGDGACKLYNDETKLCSDYENRPDICRVDLQFDLNYKDHMTWQQYLRLNMDACIALRRVN